MHTEEGLALDQVARLVEGQAVAGHGGAARITGVASISEAGPEQISFLASRRYLADVALSRAGAFLVPAELAEHVSGRAAVVVARPREALRRLLQHFHPEAETPAEIHPTAVIGRGVRIGVGVSVGPYVVLEDGVSVGDGSRIGAHGVIGRGSVLGKDCRLHPHVVLYAGTVLGARVTVHAGARLGVDGFGYVSEGGEHRKIPQVGLCVIEDDVEIGANTTVDRGSLGSTVVGRGSKLDNLVQIAHNVKLGGANLLAALVGIAGSTRVGARTVMGGQAGVIDHLDIGEDVRVAAASKVLRDVPSATVVSGNPARPNREYLRARARVERLPRLVERVAELEEAVKEIRTRGTSREE
ncbi:MAG: UDP-3-O-(3-hydroxymyristoyl)glucosamine N-acyltransferase [Gemmatimonadota bacterium]|nr:UDP-3-O-(3-hydroxymyristoyl)glucosamine N-acyltransferase [Gemmatimonadota bacterium]MDH5759109.1 UDP-3-O-(3-hydroxymyristoyl)glucosamine N-acyltransferase [Gemmatimonadota bacterium]